jgi:hypothetical protein
MTKVRVFTLLAAFSVATTIGSVPGFSQNQSKMMTVTVPFEFYVGSNKLPAGRYTISGDLPGSWAIQLKGDNGHVAGIITLASANEVWSRNSRLIFNRYNDYHFLSEVRFGGSASGRILRTSSLETQLARQRLPSRQVVSTDAER